MTTFISYSRANSDFAVRIAKDLKAAGHDIWLDQLNIPTGSRWDDEIEKALHSCSTFLLILSPDAIQSQNVKDEIGYAIDSFKHILPVIIKPCDIPFRLRRFQFVNFTDKPYAVNLAEIKGLLSNTSQLQTAKDAVTNPGMKIPPERLKDKAAVDSKSKPAVATPVEKKPKSSMGLLIGIGAAVLLVIGVLASGILGKGGSGTAPTEEATQLPVIVEPTEAVATEEAVPTEASAEEANSPAFFTEKFIANTNLDSWESFMIGDAEKAAVTPSDNGLLFSLNDPELFAYYIYKPVTDYKDVKLRLLVRNVGTVSSYVSMVCRRSGNQWYEFGVTSGGQWDLSFYNGKKISLGSGATTAVKTGQSANEYETSCIGNQISLRVNGTDVRTITNTELTGGQVGFNVSAPQYYPVETEVIEFEVSEP
jgi:TIR domain